MAGPQWAGSEVSELSVIGTSVGPVCRGADLY